ncbi:hypothetical protein PSE10C_12860 [Pseudomonas amygdali pv. eriobotryae]|uniref:Uncharacterized protein n=1 Tax=Pseudomonas amygdali pv. eriobotryae TaxID=129137 RepID=A0A9P3AFN7_PSEA0|nr:hypothetical protein PSE10A_39180 [Pseudomonas amygdali pv. eriobotryae]GFZ70544.1 hypothetical protein PSE10C_12860 [Pseudomonas amygdali pv. eriobotryae]
MLLSAVFVSKLTPTEALAIAPTLRVGMPFWTLCVRLHQPSRSCPQAMKVSSNGFSTARVGSARSGR